MKRKLIILLVLALAFIWPEALAADPASATRVAFLGPEGTYTEEATRFWFQNGETLIPKETVSDAIADLLAGNADYAVIPQENTLGGAVVGYIDALISAEDAYVTGEIILPISQTLMGLPGATLEDIRTVCSHAQGLVQSEKWRAEHLPHAEPMEMASTAAAASYVTETADKSIAAVAAPGAAGIYGLEVLAENVQITDANKTRFYVLSASPVQESAQTHLAFVATCEAQRLDDIIVEIHRAGLELVTLHDRPEGSRLGAYHYLVEAKNDNGITKQQLETVREIPEVRFLGCFQSMSKTPTP